MNDMICGETSLMDQLIEALRQNKALREEVETLKRRLEISRKLQEKPKLYPPVSDPYMGEEDGA